MKQVVYREVRNDLTKNKLLTVHACPAQVQPRSSVSASEGRQCRRNAFISFANPLGPRKYGWEQPEQRRMPGQDNVDMVYLSDIKRPLQGTRTNDAEKVEALMESIKEVGLIEPIDILLVEGKYYGFSGCHRFEACQRLGHEKILSKVRKANRSILQMHFR